MTPPYPPSDPSADQTHLIQAADPAVRRQGSPMSAWPYPGDAPLARARRVARAYREHLLRVDPDLCATLDDQMTSFGETWLAPRILRYDLDDWLSPREAADIAGVSVACVRQWRARGRLTGRHTAKGWRYRARDVLVLSGEVRRRKVDGCHP